MGIWIVLLQMGLPPQSGKGLPQSKGAARGRLRGNHAKSHGQLPTSEFRVPRSEFRVPRSAFRFSHEVRLGSVEAMLFHLRELFPRHGPIHQGGARRNWAEVRPAAGPA